MLTSRLGLLGLKVGGLGLLDEVVLVDGGLLDVMLVVLLLESLLVLEAVEDTGREGTVSEDLEGAKNEGRPKDEHRLRWFVRASERTGCRPEG